MSSSTSVNVLQFEKERNLKAQKEAERKAALEKRRTINSQALYTKEELLFHELQKMITKLTSNKSYEMSF